MIATRPTREEILAGIGYEPLVCPPWVPVDVAKEADRAVQEYLVEWALAKYKFGCTMVDIDPSSDIGDLMAQLRGEIDPTDLAGKGLEPEAHITVRYGILPDADLSDLREYLRSLAPFEIQFGVVRSFPPTEHSDDAAVLKVDVIGAALEEINAAMPEHCEFKPANFEYHAHATLAYVKPEAAEKYVGNDLLVGHTLQVHTIAIRGVSGPAEFVPLMGDTQKIAKFDGDQPRDEAGRWTSGGFSAIKVQATDRRVVKAVSRAASMMQNAGVPDRLLQACGDLRVTDKIPSDSRRLMRPGGVLEGAVGLYGSGRVWLKGSGPNGGTPYVALHEFGHHIEERIRLASVQKAMGWDREAFKASAAAALDEFRSFRGTKHESFAYAASSRHEWHAEMFAWFNHPKYQPHLMAWAPKTYAFWRGVTTGDFTTTAKMAKAEAGAESIGNPLLTGGRTADGMYWDGFAESGGEHKKMDLVATEHRCNKRAEAPGVAQARQAIKATLQHFFTKTANEIAATIRDYRKVAKASGPDSLMAHLPGIDWQGVVPSLAINLKKISKVGAARAISTLNINASRMISDINEVAADWAEQRAAEMVGMRRLPNGKLVQNPNAQWNITDKTRDDLQEIITEAFEKKTSMSELAAEIQQAGTFSEYRAAVIAKTEVIRAENQGNLGGWKTSGMVEMVDILNSADHPEDSDCDCSGLAENGPYLISDVPELPAHPGCECDYVVAQLAGQPGD